MIRYESKEAKEIIAKNIAHLMNNTKKPLYVNLGVGIPNLVANYVKNDNIYIQGENGMLGVGPIVTEERAIPNLINSGRQPVLETKGCSYFDSSTAFGMIRNGNIDIAIIGAFEVDGHGNVANWIVPNGKQLGVGGAMDLVNGAKTVIISMRHLDKKGHSKLVEECTLPLTGKGVVDYLVTEYAVFRYIEKSPILFAYNEQITLEELKSITKFQFKISEKCKTMI